MINREQAFREAFEKHSDELFRHANSRLSNRERALELTQECFLKAWEYLVGGKVIDKYRPFLFRVLGNLIIDEYRKHKVTSLDAMLENEETAVAVEGDLLRDELNLLEERAVQFDAKIAFEIAQTLPDNYRMVVLMRYIDGMSLTEIAESTGETENAISVRLHRGVKKLREMLGAQTQDNE